GGFPVSVAITNPYHPDFDSGTFPFSTFCTRNGLALYQGFNITVSFSLPARSYYVSLTLRNTEPVRDIFFRTFSVKICDLCPKSYFLFSGLYCKPCDSNCVTCAVTQSNCSFCQPGFYLSGNQCLSVCPTEKFPNTTSSTCDQ